MEQYSFIPAAQTLRRRRLASTTHKFNFSHFQKFPCPLHYDDVTLLQMNFTNLLNYSAMMRIKHLPYQINYVMVLSVYRNIYLNHTYVSKPNILMPNWINESPFDNINYYLWNNRTNWFIYGNNNMVVSFLVFHMLIKKPWQLSYHNTTDGILCCRCCNIYP